MLGLTFVWANTPPLFVLSSVLIAATWFIGGGFLIRSAAPRAHGRAGNGGGDQVGVPFPGRRRASWHAVLLASLGTAGFFLAGTWLLSQIPMTASFVRSAVVSASWTPLWLTVIVATVTGWGEEIFFRGGLPQVWGRHGQAWALLAYTLSTLLTGNVVLVLAAPLLGGICQIMYNRTDRLLAACAVHTAFSLGVVGLVPILFAP